MHGLITGLISLGLTILTTILWVGLGVGLARIALDRGGYKQTFGVLLGFVLIALAMAGQLSVVVHDISAALLNGGSSPPTAPGVWP
jgi:hypothetical protein